MDKSIYKVLVTACAVAGGCCQHAGNNIHVFGCAEDSIDHPRAPEGNLHPSSQWSPKGGRDEEQQLRTALFQLRSAYIEVDGWREEEVCGPARTAKDEITQAALAECRRCEDAFLTAVDMAEEWQGVPLAVEIALRCLNICKLWHDRIEGYRSSDGLKEGWKEVLRLERKLTSSLFSARTSQHSNNKLVSRNSRNESNQKSKERRNSKNESNQKSQESDNKPARRNSKTESNQKSKESDNKPVRRNSKNEFDHNPAEFGAVAQQSHGSSRVNSFESSCSNNNDHDYLLIAKKLIAAVKKNDASGMELLKDRNVRQYVAYSLRKLLGLAKFPETLQLEYDQDIQARVMNAENLKQVHSQLQTLVDTAKEDVDVLSAALDLLEAKVVQPQSKICLWSRIVDVVSTVRRLINRE